MRASFVLIAALAAACGSSGGSPAQPDAATGSPADARLADAGTVTVADAATPDAPTVVTVDARPADAATPADAAVVADAAPTPDAPPGADAGTLTLHLDVHPAAGGGTVQSARHRLKLEIGGVSGTSSSASHKLELHP